MSADRDDSPSGVPDDRGLSRGRWDITSPFPLLGESDPPSPTTPEREVSGLESGPAFLVVKRGPNAGSRFLLDRPVNRAGRHPDSDILLDDVTTSRRHAEFRTESGETWVVDTDSLNGTYVNRRPVPAAMLHNGDLIQIGSFHLVFLTAAAAQGSQ